MLYTITNNLKFLFVSFFSLYILIIPDTAFADDSCEADDCIEVRGTPPRDLVSLLERLVVVEVAKVEGVILAVKIVVKQHLQMSQKIMVLTSRSNVK
jgi:hypothetical protein